MSVTLKLVDFPLTAARILALSRDNPGYRFERMPTGELHVTPPVGEAGHRNSALIAQLHAWNSVSERGIVFDSSTGFVLPDGSLYAPDAAWLARDRWNALTRNSASSPSHSARTRPSRSHRQAIAPMSCVPRCACTS